MERLLGVAYDDVQQCVKNMAERLAVIVKAEANRGPHLYAVHDSLYRCESCATVGACRVRDGVLLGCPGVPFWY